LREQDLPAADPEILKKKGRIDNAAAYLINGIFCLLIPPPFSSVVRNSREADYFLEPLSF
jgi:hypothetical protein